MEYKAVFKTKLYTQYFDTEQYKISCKHYPQQYKMKCLAVFLTVLVKAFGCAS